MSLASASNTLAFVVFLAYGEFACVRRFTLAEQITIITNKTLGRGYATRPRNGVNVVVTYDALARFRQNIIAQSISNTYGRRVIGSEIKILVDSFRSVDQFLRFPDEACFLVNNEAFQTMINSFISAIEVPDCLRLEMPLNEIDLYNEKRQILSASFEMLSTYLSGKYDALSYTHRCYTQNSFESFFHLRWQVIFW